MEQIPELHIGNAAAEPLAALARRADMDFLIRWINIEGPERIIEFLQSKDPSITYPWDKVHPCEACRDIHRRPDLREAVRRYHGEKVGEILLHYQLREAVDSKLRSARPAPSGQDRTASPAGPPNAQQAGPAAGPQGRPLLPVSPAARRS